MNKQSLLEVDFEHLAWEPVDPQAISGAGTLVPIKMARGKHEVYLNVKFDTSTPVKESEYKEFEKAFEEIDTKRKNKVSDLFLSAIGTNDNEDGVKDTGTASYDDLVSGIGSDEEDIELIKANEEEDLADSNEEDLRPEEQELEDENATINEEEYEPSREYKNYIINIEEKRIDSGWNDINAAEQRLAEIEKDGAENYTIHPYNIKLFKFVGDPTRKKWQTYGLANFYIINKTKGEVDSAWDNRAEANKRLKEVEALIERHNKLHAPEEGEDDISSEETDLSIRDEYSIEKGTSAIEEYGYSVTHKEIFVSIEEYISAVEKELKKLNENLMLESVLTELADPKNVSDSFYLTFGFSRDFNSSDDSGRKGHSDEYSELEIYLKDFISADGSVEISSKEFRKACDKAKAKRAYQSTIKTLNHTADYFYNNLGFGKKEDLSKLGKGAQSDYNIKADDIVKNPSPDISNEYVSANSGSKESNQYDVGFDQSNSTKDSRIAYAEKIGIEYVRKAKERLYTVINDPKYVNQFKDYIDYADDVETYIDDNYHPDKAHLSAQFREEIEEFFKASEDLKEAHAKIKEEITPKDPAKAKARGHIGNTPVIRTSMNSGSEVGVALHTDPRAIEAKNKYKEIYNTFAKLPSSERRAKTNEEYQKIYGEKITDTLNKINKDREATARAKGGYPKMRESNREDNKEIKKPSRKKI